MDSLESCNVWHGLARIHAVANSVNEPPRLLDLLRGIQLPFKMTISIHVELPVSEALGNMIQTTDLERFGRIAWEIQVRKYKANLGELQLGSPAGSIGTIESIHQTKQSGDGRLSFR